MNRRGPWLALAALLLLAALASWWWQRPQPAISSLPADSGVVGSLPAASGMVGSAPAASTPASAASEPLAATAPPASTEAALTASDWPAALTALLGRDKLLSGLQSDDFARRLVATVDNLGRDMAPSRLWPVNPSPGRFEVSQQGGSTVIAAGNSARYDGLMALLQAAPTPALVALYARAYPQLQLAYAELGYPKGSFHQRLLEVLDLLLATPQPAPPLALKLTEVKGSVPSTRPWVRYELADPQLEQLAAGQKILLRVGPAHGQRLRLRLAELRAALLAAPSTPR